MKHFGSYKEGKFEKPSGRFEARGASADPIPVRAKNVSGAARKDPVLDRSELTDPYRRSANAPQAPTYRTTQSAPQRTSTANTGRKRTMSKRRRRKKRLITLGVICGVLLLIYLFLCWIPWRGLAPQSALHSFQSFMIRNSRESHSFQWVQYFFPSYVRQPYVDEEALARQEQMSHNTSLNPADIVVTEPADGRPIINSQVNTNVEDTLTQEQLDFYTLFYQLDVESAEKYFAKHPNVVANGYDRIYLNEAGLDDEGTDIYTTSGEQVLAIDAVNEILLIRVKGSRYRGVLAIAKDPEQLHLYTSAGMSTVTGVEGYGQTAGKIANSHNGVLAITGSGFLDEEGVGTGGALVGFCRSDGASYGKHRGWGCKRLELREDNWLYITDAYTDCRSDVTNAMEFEPALIVDGKKLDSYVYTAENPRACVGQTDKGEILMLAIEGRQGDIAGCGVSECSDILLRYRCITAMNMDGGTSAMLWYNGEPVIRCNNLSTPEGRYLPNAWVYVRKD